LYRALLLDFYGTLVAEDDALVVRISEQVAAASGRGASASDVARAWHERFAEICAAAYGPTFRTQRKIEVESLAHAAHRFDAAIDVEALAGEMFAYWAAPTPLDGADAFLRESTGPVCVVSNIDTAELHAAMRGLGWDFEHVVTSEGCRAYKPRPEMFRAALAALGCEASEVLHVGDSLGSDVTGAARLGIDVAWVNPANRALPGAIEKPPRHIVRSVADVLPLIGSRRAE
jgi:2-haloacid dehalogenase/putative hydrolase of the HAD superfamily